MYGPVAQGYEFVLTQSFADMVGLNKVDKLLSVFRQNEHFGVTLKYFHVRYFFADVKWNVFVHDFTVAYRNIGFEVYIEHAFIFGGKSVNHVALFASLAFLVDNLLLKQDFVFELFLLDAVFCICNFLFDAELGGAACLDDDECEQYK